MVTVPRPSTVTSTSGTVQRSQSDAHGLWGFVRSTVTLAMERCKGPGRSRIFAHASSFNGDLSMLQRSQVGPAALGEVDPRQSLRHSSLVQIQLSYCMKLPLDFVAFAGKCYAQVRDLCRRRHSGGGLIGFVSISLTLQLICVVSRSSWQSITASLSSAASLIPPDHGVFYIRFSIPHQPIGGKDA